MPDELDVPVAEDLYGHYGDPDHPDGPERVRDAFIHVIETLEDEGVTDPSWFESSRPDRTGVRKLSDELCSLHGVRDNPDWKSLPYDFLD
ncbi:MAG: hypothetical protein WD492_18290 [Alkalispirochaeta sp.]